MVGEFDINKENETPSMRESCPASPTPGFGRFDPFPSPKKKSDKRILSESTASESTMSESTPTTASSKCSLAFEALRFDDDESSCSSMNQESWIPDIPRMRPIKRKNTDKNDKGMDCEMSDLRIPLLVRDPRLHVGGQSSSSRFYKKSKDDVQNVSFLSETLPSPTHRNNLRLHPRPLRGCVSMSENEKVPTPFASNLSPFPDLGSDPLHTTPPSTPKSSRAGEFEVFASPDKANSRVFHSPQWTRPVSLNPFTPVAQRYLNNSMNAPSTCPSRIAIGTPNKRNIPRHSAIRDTCPPSPKFVTSLISHKCPETPSRHCPAGNRFSMNNGDREVESSFSISSPICAQSSRFETDFELLKTIGDGSFGTVHEVAARLDGCLYAVKVMKRSIRGEYDRRKVLKEVHALAALCDQAKEGTFHIVRYHQAWIEDDRLYIQTELCDKTLREEIERNSRFPQNERETWKLLREILLALDLIHSNNMAHLDIKPDNIFSKDNKYKLGDFGLAQVSCNNKDAEEGDERYMARELLSETSNCDLTKCDIFSLGMTAFEMTMGSRLPSNGNMWHELRKGNVFSTSICSKSQQVSADLDETINLMLHPNPDKRPSATSLLERQQLLSEERRELLIEKERVRKANEALGEQRLQYEKSLGGPIGSAESRIFRRSSVL